MTQFTSKDLQESFNWIGRKRKGGGRGGKTDISVVLLKPVNGRQRVMLVIRNDSHEILGERIELATVKNRIYFRENSSGLKISCHGNGTSSRYTLTLTVGENEKQLLSFKGDYDLKFDQYVDLYYIEKEE